MVECQSERLQAENILANVGAGVGDGNGDGGAAGSEAAAKGTPAAALGALA